MKLSVICVAYNRPVLLREFLRSVIAQDDQRWEMLIADDNSNDPYTESICREFVRQYPGFYFKSEVSEEERPQFVRYSVGINSIVSYATGDILCYAADDIEWIRPDLVRTVLTYFETHPLHRAGYIGAEVVFTDYRNGAMSSQWRTRRPWPWIGCPIWHPACKLDGAQIFHCREDFRDWPIGPEYWKGADAWFLEELAQRVGPIQPIADPLNEVFVLNKMNELSVTANPLAEVLAKLHAIGGTYEIRPRDCDLPGGPNHQG